MSGAGFESRFDEARRQPLFHKELAILAFTEELCRAMEDQGVSHTELARRIGSSQAYISRVLNGGANFTLASMTKLCAALGLELRMHLASAESSTTWHDAYADDSARRADDSASPAA